MRARLVCPLVMLLWCALAPGRARGELGGLPSLDPHGFVAFASTRAPGPWLLDASLALSYEAEPWRGLGTDTMQRVDARLSPAARLRVGLGGRGALRLAVPAVVWTRGAGSEPGLSDGWMGLSVRVWGAPTDARGHTPEGAALSLDAGSSLPWGATRTYATGTQPRLTAGATADMRAFGVVAGARLGYARWVSAPPAAIGRDRLSLALALQVPVPLFSRLAPEKVAEHWLVELAVATDPGAAFERERSPLEARSLWRLSMGEWTVSAGGTVALLRALDTPVATALASVHYAPRPQDQDVDDVVDADDACPHLAEDIDGFEDEDGCPEPDNDGDGILDEDDRCPLVPSDYELDQDEDGCNDPR